MNYWYHWIINRLFKRRERANIKRRLEAFAVRRAITPK